MKLPQFIRNLVPVSIAIFVISFIAIFFFSAADLNLLAIISGIIAGLSYFTFMGAATLIRVIENALLRQFGQPATAKVLDFRGIKTGTRHGHTMYGGMRAKLEVIPLKGETFIAVAEDSYDIGLQLEVGKLLPVKYDPLTREVALAISPKTVKKSKDF